MGDNVCGKELIPSTPLFRCDGVVEVKPKPKSIKQFFDKHLSWSGKELDKHDQ